MKKRSMILALASMLGISAAATAVSGFAWFTTQRTAEINTSVYKVGAAEGSLKVEFTTNEKAWNCAPTSPSTNVISVNPTSTKALADVSSNTGSAFRKVKFDTTNEIQDIVDETTKPTASGEWLSSVNTQQMVAVSWQLKVTNDGAADTSMDVMLSHAGELFVTNMTETDDADYSKYFRMSIDAAVDGAAATNVFTYTNAGHKRYLDGNESLAYKEGAEDAKAAARASALRGHGEYGTNDYMSGSLNAIIDASSTGYVKADNALPNNQKLVKNLGGQKSAILTFTVWCEGTATPEEECKANSVKTSMTLVGINALA